MRTFKYNMAFVIVLISFYCSVAIGSPPLGAEYSAPSKDSEPIRIDIKNETESLSIEEILSTKKYLETAKKEGFPEKSPDREHQPIVVGKEVPSTVVGKGDHPTVSSLELHATSLTTQTPTEGSETLSIIPEKNRLPLRLLKKKSISMKNPLLLTVINQLFPRESPFLISKKRIPPPSNIYIIAFYSIC